MTKSDLDQFYTKPEIAKLCFSLTISYLKERQFDFWLEPSAGCGNFYKLLPDNKIGIDLEPFYDGIITQDFFDFIPQKGTYIVIGNPPFGKNASLAIKFFNKAAQFSETIAFIVPKSFRKISVQNKLNLYFHLATDYDLPNNSFILFGDKDNIDYSVETCFQIWDKKNIKREVKKPPLTHPDFEWTTPALADFSLRRVGVNAGKASLDLTFATSSNYFIKSNIYDLYPVFCELGPLFKEAAKNTAANPSLSKSEVVDIYTSYRAK